MKKGWIFGELSERSETTGDLCVFANKETFIIPDSGKQPVLSEVIILTPTELTARERKAFEAGREAKPTRDSWLPIEDVGDYHYPTFTDYQNSEEYKQ